MPMPLILLRLSLAVALVTALPVACNDSGPFEPTPKEPARLRIVVETTGADLDVDGYDLVVEAGSAPQRVGPSDSKIISLAPGTYTVSLTHVGANCSIAGANPRAVTVAPGATVEMSFVIVCEATGVTITTRTASLANAPATYDLILDGRTLAPLGANGSVTVSRLTPGPHVVTIVPPVNCAASGGNSVTVEIENRKITPVLFEVTCVAPARPEKLAYATFSNGFLVVANIDGSNPVQLVIGREHTWSPDGAWLVYSDVFCGDYYYHDGSPCTGGLVIVDPEVGNVIPVNNGAEGTQPAWSSAGDLAFIRSGLGSDPEQLWVMRADGSQAMRLVPQSAAIPHVSGVYDPTWSPDGRQIAFTCLIGLIESSNSDICVVNKDGTGLTRVTASARHEFRPAWSPDGRHIAYTMTDDANVSQVTLVETDGGAIRQDVPAAARVFRQIALGFDPAWSPNGAKIVFARAGGLFAMDLDGSNVTRLTTGNHYAPAWRPVQSAP